MENEQEEFGGLVKFSWHLYEKAVANFLKTHCYERDAVVLWASEKSIHKMH